MLANARIVKGECLVGGRWVRCACACVFSSWLTFARDGGGALREMASENTLYPQRLCMSFWWLLFTVCVTVERLYIRVIIHYSSLPRVDSTMLFLLLKPRLWCNDASMASEWRLISYPQGPVSVRCQWMLPIRSVPKKWRWESENICGSMNFMAVCTDYGVDWLENLLFIHLVYLQWRFYSRCFS